MYPLDTLNRGAAIASSELASPMASLAPVVLALAAQVPLYCNCSATVVKHCLLQGEGICSAQTVQAVQQGRANSACVTLWPSTELQCPHHHMRWAAAGSKHCLPWSVVLRCMCACPAAQHPHAHRKVHAHECCWHRQQSRTSPLLTCHQGWQQYYLLVSFFFSILLLLALFEHDLEAD